MEIRYMPSFKRAYKKLERGQRDRVDAALILFQRSPFDPKLRNHKITLSKEDARSISAGYDLRILYVVRGDAIVLLIAVGTHDEVY
jgi:addiction module RelE/StbE family toxin